jgi:hypothetical protein
MRLSRALVLFICMAGMFSAASASRAGETYAVLIGIGDYKNFRLPLAGAENDVAYMYELLVDEERGLGVPNANIQRLVTEDAERSAIKSAIVDAHARERDTSDLLIVYFSGHGTLNRTDAGNEGEPCVLPYGAQPSGPSTFISLHNDLAGWLRTVRARKIVILDACYTAAGDRGAPADGSDSKAILDLGIGVEQSLEASADVVVYASGLDANSVPQPAYERDVDGKTFGAFTHAFVQAVRSVSEGPITVQRAAESATTMLEARPDGRRQTPVVRPLGAEQVVLVDRDFRSIRVTVERPADRLVKVTLDGVALDGLRPGGTIRAPDVRVGVHRVTATEVVRPGAARVYEDLRRDIRVPPDTHVKIALRPRTSPVTGWVVNENGDAIVGAAVHLLPKGAVPPGAAVQGVTDADGAFTIDAALGTYAGISALATGYDALREESQGSALAAFTVPGHSASRIRVFLRQSPSSLRFRAPLPAGVEVRVDGVKVEEPRQEMGIGAGVPHVLALKREGYQTIRLDVPSISAGATHTLPRLSWIPLPAAVKVLAVDSATGSRVAANVGGGVSGSAGNYIAVKAPGSLTIRVSHPDYRTSTQTVSVGPGKRVERTVELIRKAGNLRLSADVAGVTIEMDGELLSVIGVAERSVPAPVGTHRLTATKEGYEVDRWTTPGHGSTASSSREVSVSEGRATRVVVHMRQIPATLVVTTNRDHVNEQRELLVDGQVRGTTPYTGRVKVGRHTIAVRVYDGGHIAATAVATRTMTRGLNSISLDPVVPPPGMVMQTQAKVDVYGIGVPVAFNAYAIDRDEVTVAEFRAFLAYIDKEGNGSVSHVDQPLFYAYEPGDWATQIERPDEPAAGVSWFAAYAYAQWRKKRLPTEAEWVRALGCGGSLEAVRKIRPPAREWVSDYFHEDYVARLRRGEAATPGPRRVIRGCDGGRSTRLGVFPLTNNLMDGRLGFRCVVDVD